MDEQVAIGGVLTCLFIMESEVLTLELAERLTEVVDDNPVLYDPTIRYIVWNKSRLTLK